VIKAMGGRLEIRAVFPDHGTVEIDQFAAAEDERVASVR
jgi:hypothetical protein